MNIVEHQLTVNDGDPYTTLIGALPGVLTAIMTSQKDKPPFTLYIPRAYHARFKDNAEPGGTQPSECSHHGIQVNYDVETNYVVLRAGETDYVLHVGGTNAIAGIDAPQITLEIRAGRFANRRIVSLLELAHARSPADALYLGLEGLCSDFPRYPWREDVPFPPPSIRQVGASPLPVAPPPAAQFEQFGMLHPAWGQEGVYDHELMISTDHLTPVAKGLAEEILQMMTKLNPKGYSTGGCAAFHNPSAMSEHYSDEELGMTTALVVMHDGGDFAHAFNPAYETHHHVDAMRELLGHLGFDMWKLNGASSKVYRVR